MENLGPMEKIAGWPGMGKTGSLYEKEVRDKESSQSVLEGEIYSYRLINANALN
jgi:hypothetical protein